MVVGVCGYCGGDVVMERPADGAACPCGRVSVPARFMELAAIPRRESTAASIDRLARRWC